MSSEGLKMGGGRYGSAWSGRKKAKFGDPPWGPPLCSPARSELVRRRLAVKIFRKVASPSSSSLAGACNKEVAGNVSHGKNLFGLKTVQNDPVWGPQVCGNFSRVLELKMSVLGLGFYLARKTRFI